MDIYSELCLSNTRNVKVEYFATGSVFLLPYDYLSHKNWTREKELRIPEG